MNKLPSLHWFIFFLSVFVPFMGFVLNAVLYATDSLPPGSTLFEPTIFYVCVMIWWIFAMIAGMHPENKPDDIRYVKWLMLLPATVLVFNWFVDNPVPFDERMLWFNSVVVTWVLSLGWILVDWYRWKYNPSVRQQRIIARRIAYDKRRAEIDKIPNCMVPSDLKLITQD